MTKATQGSWWPAGPEQITAKPLMSYLNDALPHAADRFQDCHLRHICTLSLQVAWLRKNIFRLIAWSYLAACPLQRCSSRPEDMSCLLNLLFLMSLSACAELSAQTGPRLSEHAPVDCLWSVLMTWAALFGNLSASDQPRQRVEAKQAARAGCLRRWRSLPVYMENFEQFGRVGIPDGCWSLIS